MAVILIRVVRFIHRRGDSARVMFMYL